MIAKELQKVEQERIKKDVQPFSVGDSVKVHAKVLEGDKERVQTFSGTVIAKDHGGVRETFTVRRISHGVGVEKVFPLHSPSVVKIEVERSSHTRRAKLYYLRERKGKGTKLRETSEK